MRSLLVFGITIAFIASAFVPPSEANFRSLAERAKATIEQRMKVSLPGTGIPDTAELKKAAKLMQTLAKDPQATVLIEDALKTAKTQDYSGLWKSAASLLKKTLPASQGIASTVTDRLMEDTGTQAVSRWIKLISAEKDPVLHKQLERIDWAAKKGDVRLCRELTLGEVINGGNGPSTGDLLAFCLAKVLGEGERCAQMSDASEALRAVCQEELATGPESLPGLRLL